MPLQFSLPRNPQLTISKQRVYEIKLIFCLKSVLVYLYVVFVHKYFDYLWLPLDISHLKLFEAVVVLTVLAVFVPERQKSPASTGLKIILMILILPLVSFYWLTDAPRLYFYQATMGFFITCLIVRSAPQLAANSFLIERTFGRETILSICLGLSGLAFITIFLLNDPPSLGVVLLDSGAVAARRDAVDFGHPIIGYVVNWHARVIAPFFLTIGILYKRYWISGMAIVSNAVLYSYTSDTFYLLIPLMVFFTVISSQREIFFPFTLKATTVGLVSLYLFHVFTGHIRLLGIFARRIFFVPARIQFDYYTFFSKPENPYMKLGEVGFVPFVSSPYNSPSPLLIRGDIAWTSTAYLSDAYMNLGVLGVLGFSIALGVLLVIIESISRDVPIVAIGVFVTPIFSLMNHGLTTTFLTGGIFFAVFIILLYYNSEDLFSTSHSLS